MRNRNLILPILLCFCLPAWAETGWFTRLEPALAEARTSGKYLLVDLYADWCTWCRVLDEKVFSTPRFREYAAGRFVLLRVDTEDRGEGADLLASYGVTALPTILVLDARMVKVGAVEGFATTELYIDRLERELALYRRLEEAFKARASLETDSKLRLAEDLHGRRDGLRAATLYEEILAAGDLAGPYARRIRYRLADSHRLAGNLDRALEVVAEVQTQARKAGDEELVAAADLLQISVAQERGDCEGAARGLETFRTSHHQERLPETTRRLYDSLKREVHGKCS